MIINTQLALNNLKLVCSYALNNYKRPFSSALIVYITSTLVDVIYSKTCAITIDLSSNYSNNNKTYIDITFNGNETKIASQCLNSLDLKGALLGGFLATIYNVYVAYRR